LAGYYIIKDNNSVERAMLSSVFCDESKGRGRTNGGVIEWLEISL
jgi:hypothetical protein